MSDDLTVTGGAGGVEVAVEDLRGAAATLRRSAGAMACGTPRDVVVELPVPPAARHGPDWDLAARLLGAPSTLLLLVGRCRTELVDVVTDVGEAVERLRDLADSLSRAASTYEWGESSVRGLVGGLHGQAVGAAWLITQLTGRAFGLLDEGEGWDVEVTAGEVSTSSPVEPSAQWLLSGLDGLGHDGGVRVVQVPVADGSTTWVVQVPGTHGGVMRGGEVPMDWPANVSLMLRETSASKVATVKALELAQAGHATARDRVVLVGFSQGGLVAASLASDPQFRARHRVSHVVTAGAPIDEFPVPDSTSVLSLQQRGDPVHALDVSPPPDRRDWTTVTSRAAATATGAFRFHDLGLYRGVAARADASGDVSLTTWRRGVAPALTPAAGSTPVVHEFRSRRRWHNRDS